MEHFGVLMSVVIPGMKHTEVQRSGWREDSGLCRNPLIFRVRPCFWFDSGFIGFASSRDLGKGSEEILSLCHKD
jgi:hypothetical protein